MMAPNSLPRSLLWLLVASLASAQSTIDSLSFGHRGQLESNGGIAGWKGSGVNHNVQVLSDRAILTPPVPGNAKGALWSEATNPSTDWTAQVEFRASGQEYGSGNLQIWYTKDRDAIGTNSVYNVEKFDGLVLVIDQYGGGGGKIRGFLNDGGKNFRTSTSLESLAFGHCDYSYRNLGRPSKLKISNQGGLHVSVDDKTCFQSDKIVLPAGYYFGLTASTGENPDSFEVTKFLTTSGGSAPAAGSTHQQYQAETQQQIPQLQKMDSLPNAPEMLPDRDADQIKGDKAQFEDVHNRLQTLSHHIGTVYYELKGIADKIDAKHAEVLRQVENIKGSKDTGLPPETVGQIKQLHERVTNMEAVLNIVRSDVENKDYRKDMDDIHHAMSFLNHKMSNEMPGHFKEAIRSHTPNMSTLLILLIVFQVLLAGGYVLYKKRRHSMPKKFL